jgi:hypothetical protein
MLASGRAAPPPIFFDKTKRNVIHTEVELAKPLSSEVQSSKLTGESSGSGLEALLDATDGMSPDSPAWRNAHEGMLANCLLLWNSVAIGEEAQLGGTWRSGCVPAAHESCKREHCVRLQYERV